VLRNRQLGGLKFRRQHPIGPYIVDFFCHESKLVIELDGQSHEGKEHYDNRRQQYLESQGYRVFRVLNDDVLDDVDAVARGIATAAGITLD
jgi:very-short-patch-repair endonuclease